MLKIARDQGIKEIFATSHFNEIIPPDVENDYFDKLNILREKVDSGNLNIILHQGSELFYHLFLDKTIQKSAVATLAGLGQYVLIEFSLFIMPTGVKDVLFKLSLEDVTPIIAHPERYSSVIDKQELVLDYIHHGALLQVNAGSILGDFGKEVQKISMWLFENKLVHFIGSDAHGIKGRRTFKLRQAVEELKYHFNEEDIMPLVTENPRKIIDSEKIEKTEIPLHLLQDEGFFGKLKKKFSFSKKDDFSF
jgi:protein-tyrosine phosphatase